MPHAMRIFPITNIAIAPDPAGMFAACEDAYEQATREGYAENPAVRGRGVRRAIARRAWPGSEKDHRGQRLL